MNQAHGLQKILQLAGEGGGLTLYCMEKDGTLRYWWQSLWTIPDETGRIPTRTPDQEPKSYASIREAMDAAPRYWALLFPVFVRDDFRDLFVELVSARFATLGLPSPEIEDKLDRWKRGGRPRPRVAP